MSELPIRPHDLRFLTFITAAQTARLPNNTIVPFTDDEVAFLKGHIVKTLLVAERHQTVLAQDPESLLAIRQKAEEKVRQEKRFFHPECIQLEATTDGINDLLYYYLHWAFATPHHPEDRAFGVICATNFVCKLLAQVVYHPWRSHTASGQLYDQAMKEYLQSCITEGLLNAAHHTSVQPVLQPSQLKDIFDQADYQRALAITPGQIETWRQDSPAKLMGLGVVKNIQGVMTNPFYIKDVSLGEGGHIITVQYNDGE
ncbi:hypothetical protein H0H92_013262, partial [Tricholoma furcatifolium]